MKIALSTPYWNDKLGLERLFNSIDISQEGIPDYWIVIDGKYDLNDSPNIWSTDGSSEYLISLGEVVNGMKIIHKEFHGTEHDKRQIYLDLCRELDIDILIRIDSDEYFSKVNWKLLRDFIPNLNQKVNYHCIWSCFTGKSYGWYPKLWIRPYEIDYWNAHCLFKNRKTGIITRSTSVNGDELFKEVIQIRGDDTLRTKDYLHRTFQYQEKMIQREKPFRRAVF
ncbi:glycosyltransferase [Nitrososphaeria virus YSH_1032793]|uniref:Glycosyltransferase n=1 Tax=Nitrososphaeria virus YSH_1032793 TaxID=3071320 RepID=A0A976UAE0_9CAUD|nr:glycosyltransferase [Yangshan Harbor Nitrososphaeria virus]UVF62248.1 glycosyltransferase [Nitrososphaeria virus YSH_1032793]